jgi:hypothetical protein
MNIKFNVYNITKPNAVPAIYDFLFPKFANAHRITLIILYLDLLYASGEDNVSEHLKIIGEP